MTNLTPQQQQVLRAFNTASNRKGAGPKIRKALVEAGLVESGLRNLNYGDRDSLGALQQRPSAGWKNARNPEKAAEDFIAHAKPIAGQYGRAGDLAQAVQRSAFPGRYQQQSQTANQLLHASGRFPSASAGSKGGATRTIPGQDRSGERRSLLLNYLLGNSGGDLLNTVTKISQVKDTPAKSVSVTQGVSNGLGRQEGNYNIGRIQARASTIAKQHLPYQWGGGHAGKTPVAQAIPLDCSGAVSKVLGINPRVAGQFEQWGKAGKDPSGGLTVYAKSSHVIVEINGHFWGTSGLRGPGKSTGAGWIPRKNIPKGYLNGFVARHAG